MDLVDSEIVGIIYQLLPGFIAAWIFYGLTAHQPKSPFERTIQALIFTAFTQALVIPLGSGLKMVGNRYFSLGNWDKDAAFITSVIIACGLGLCFSVCANKNFLHKRLADWITKRTSHPSEWFSAFNTDKRYIYLHLTGGRRLFCWPTEWPDHPGVGHFVVEEAEWILDDNTRVPLYLTKRLLIAAKDVEMVEFEKNDAERQHSAEDQNEAEKILTALHLKKETTQNDGRSEENSTTN